ncbi:hypothetical protein [Clostridium boliviensis]|nr:hypothetical protein [Clostridium boliviensis]
MKLMKIWNIKRGMLLIRRDRRKGLEVVCAASLIIECLDRGGYPAGAAA